MLRLITGLVALSVSAAAIAAPAPNEIRYDFVDFSTTRGEVELFDVDVDISSYSFAASFGVSKYAALFASVGKAELELSDLGPVPNIDTTVITLGVNPHFEIIDNVDVVIPVALKRAEVDDGLFADDETGYSIGLGLRALPLPSLELGIGVERVDLGEDDVFYAASARWHATSLISVAFGATVDSDSTELGLNLRLTF